MAIMNCTPVDRTRKVTDISECPALPDDGANEVRHIPGYPGYAISESSRIWSCNNTRNTRQWRELKPYQAKNGYRYTHLRRHGMPSVREKIGRLVAISFLGPCPDGMELCHGDGDRANDCLCNLRWDTRLNNVRDAIRHGTFKYVRCIGEDGPTCKLTDAQVAEIRNNTTDSRNELARKYGVTNCTIRTIKLNISRTKLTPVEMRP